jgi:hypothetical protein
MRSFIEDTKTDSAFSEAADWLKAAVACEGWEAGMRIKHFINHYL